MAATAPLTVQPKQANQGRSIVLVDATGQIIAEITPKTKFQRSHDEENFARLAALWNADAANVVCSPEEYEAAVDLYSSDDINIDPNALTSHGDDGTWVQAWVLIPNENDVEEPDPRQVHESREVHRSVGDQEAFEIMSRQSSHLPKS